ncbi:hypothetical protein HOLleu_03204 [Holothuria leucospilota]|uniref:Uncharacterized protein n=1 Tax=Holothuria leucospilota TaxID=206669 RepID=A0A9Q1HHH4_HOLLE|nr:hypothetical protein HOLleu_03204 [Holothuria leucospilota]
MASDSSTEDEDQSSNLCCIHVCSDVSENLIPFKEKSWIKVLSCAPRWQEIDCIEGEIAKQTREKFGILDDSDSVPIPQGAGYHGTCYQRFCHVRRLQAAEERKRKNPKGNDTDSHEDTDQKEASSKKQATSSRVLRSTFTGVQHDVRRPHVLPDLCIICQSTLREMRTTGGRCKAKLVKCEKKEAKTFLDAARLHGEERVLLQI